MALMSDTYHACLRYERDAVMRSRPRCLVLRRYGNARVSKSLMFYHYFICFRRLCDAVIFFIILRYVVCLCCLSFIVCSAIVYTEKLRRDRHGMRLHIFLIYIVTLIACHQALVSYMRARHFHYCLAYFTVDMPSSLFRIFSFVSADSLLLSCY